MKSTLISQLSESTSQNSTEFHELALKIRTRVSEMTGVPVSFISYRPDNFQNFGKKLPVNIKMTIDPKHGELYNPTGMEHELLMHVFPLAIKSAFKKIDDCAVDVEDMGENWVANRYTRRWKVTASR